MSAFLPKNFRKFSYFFTNLYNCSKKQLSVIIKSMKTVCFIGMMGAGKTTLTKLLSDKLNIRYVDLDSLIESNEKMSVSEIFKTKGEQYFRKVEKDTLQNIFKPQGMIISLGGGAFENEKTRELLLNNALVIYLKTSPDCILNRIKDDKSRPLLANNMTIDRISEILNKREQNYLLAHKVIITDKKTPLQIIQEIYND